MMSRMGAETSCRTAVITSGTPLAAWAALVSNNRATMPDAMGIRLTLDIRNPPVW
ncbi:hypothetical protein GCM10009105_30930 [Dokdonella soli]|uniref:Uncharacterized protein n=1 Tax=Dokdonella soli TaxID=529810 RepID=A0ABN1ITT9_9GAMM